jgi:hypothetical protein
MVLTGFSTWLSAATICRESGNDKYVGWMLLALRAPYFYSEHKYCKLEISGVAYKEIIQMQHGGCNA